MTKDELEYACSLLPEGAYWGYNITAQMALHIAQAARATAEQSRDRVIEECAAVLDRRINGWRARGKTILNGQTVADELEHHAHAIRALKSQQDAAIEAQRSGDGS